MFIEYLKYLVIATLNEYQVAPSFWIDQMWHSHMTHTKHYRDTCIFIKNVFEKEMDHLNISPRDFIAHLPGDNSEEKNNKISKLEQNTRNLL